MQSIHFIGRLSRDVDLKTTPNGVQVASFTVAVDRKQKDTEGNKKVDFFNVNVWRGLADICSKYLSKGKKCYVRGELQMRTYTAKDGTTKVSLDVQADEVEFLSSKTESRSDADDSGVTDADGFSSIDPSEIPF